MALCFSVLSSLGFTLAAPLPPEEQAILDLEKKLLDAWSKNDVPVLEEIVADDFQYWSFKGERRSKADLLKQIAQAQNSGDTETTTEVHEPVVRIFGDAAILTCRITDKGKRPDGQPFLSRTTVTDVFVRRDGRWQLVALHEAIIPEKK